MKARWDYYSQYMENHTICLGRIIHFASSSNHFDKDWLVSLPSIHQLFCIIFAFFLIGGIPNYPPEKYEFVRLIIIPTIGENKIHVPNHQAVKL